MITIYLYCRGWKSVWNKSSTETCHYVTKAGKDVGLFLLSGEQKWCEFEGYKIPVINLEDTEVRGKIRYMIATMWTTVDIVEQCIGAEIKMYLVQIGKQDFIPKEIR